MQFILMFLLAGCMSLYSGKKSDHFDGEKFFNKYPPTTDKSFFTLLKWKFTSKAANWPKWIESKSQKLLPERTDKIKATFINHASVFIQVGGVNIITDPHFSMRTSPVDWAGPKRVRRPGIELEDLPKIDFVLVSHNHYDHLDLKSLAAIYKINPAVKILVGLGNKKLLDENEIPCIELDWEESIEINGGKIFFMPAHHWSARGLWDKRYTLWGSFVIETNRGNIYFAGDTGYSPHFKDIQSKFREFSLALLPIGAYAPRWFMKNAHINPEEAVKAHLDLKSKKSIGIHFGTFQLTDEPIDEPIKLLDEAKIKYNVNKEEFVALGFGASLELE